MRRLIEKINIKYSLALIAIVGVSLLQACEEEDATIGSPMVTSFTPTAGGPVGTFVTVSGKYFSTTKPTTVKFNGVEAETLEVSPTSIQAIVPAGATSGQISVEVEGYTGTSTSAFAVTSGTPAPVILSFSPTTGNGVDDVSVTIKGVNFSTTAAQNIVKFNGVLAAAPTSASARSLTVKVPAGVTTGKITVEVQGAPSIATSPADFTAVSPTVASFTPKSSIVGSTVVITGTNFSPTAANNVVKFNGVNATVSQATATSLTVIVPAGATTGKVSVTVDEKTGTSTDNFTVN
ncbi:IPT/TIG domain-containing protein [Ohtaekwangia koreensis]|uniref:IPT/TIG domain-containing protein n=1 Tax=Ohtaekwangia koreensis TaxID=688867 RepID=A0A1T5KD08_9BACT|nr:IPT/TIG domain-containing protein [Ohtaekwangia koreensis]SKC61268.1 hypothetical protein SAMN05660236_2025 [Ohtaekwangia koreensis]